MEPNAQYALHDAAPALQWAAHVRLTPELLAKLQRGGKSASMSLRLNTAGTGSVGRSKRVSVLTVNSLESEDDSGDDEATGTEEYELLSFPEDPRTNHVCTFRAEGQQGFAVHKTGAVHQKLIVQRLLDSIEKHRMKDRHAQSVRESKARASKLIDAAEATSQAATKMAFGKRRRPTPVMRAMVAPTTPKRIEEATPALRLPSALSAEEAQATRERIDRGSEQGAVEPMAVESASAASLWSTATTAALGGKTFESDGAEDEQATVPVIAPAKTPSAGAAPTKRKKAAKDSAKNARSTKIATPAHSLPMELAADAKNIESTAATPRKRARKASSNSVERIVSGTVHSEEKTQSKSIQQSSRQSRPIEVEAPASRPSPATEPVSTLSDRPAVHVKRPRPRSVPMPDLSFFPPQVVEICRRVALHNTRSAIIDDADYDAFVEQHEAFRQDWEMLDKAYSAEVIRCEGLHLLIDMAPTPERRAECETKLQAAGAKREGLLFVQTTMAAVQKILAGIQTSIWRSDRKIGSDLRT